MIQWSQIRQAIARKRSKIYLISCMQIFLNEPLGVLIAVENRTRNAALKADLLFLGVLVLLAPKVLFSMSRCVGFVLCLAPKRLLLYLIATNRADKSDRPIKSTRKKIHISNNICFFFALRQLYRIYALSTILTKTIIIFQRYFVSFSFSMYKVACFTMSNRKYSHSSYCDNKTAKRKQYLTFVKQSKSQVILVYFLKTSIV